MLKIISCIMATSEKFQSNKNNSASEHIYLHLYAYLNSKYKGPKNFIE